MKNILIINAHQFYADASEGKLNQALVDVAKEEFEKNKNRVKTTTIEKGYKIKEEIQKHLWANIIITQTPVYWFSTPWIHKKYIDEVFTAGLVEQSLVADNGLSKIDLTKQYGTGGKMKGKKFMISQTWNAPKEVFGDEKQNFFKGKNIDDIFVPLTLTYKFCGTEILPSFSCHNIKKDSDIQNDIKRLREHIKRVCL